MVEQTLTFVGNVDSGRKEMKIIKAGIVPTYEEYIEECPNCHTVFSFYDNEGSLTDFYGVDVISVRCPMCFIKCVCEPKWPKFDLDAARQAMKDFEEGNSLTIDEILLKLKDEKHENN